MGVAITNLWTIIFLLLVVGHGQLVLYHPRYWYLPDDGRKKWRGGGQGGSLDNLRGSKSDAIKLGRANMHLGGGG